MGNESIEEIPRHRKCRYYVPGGFTELEKTTAHQTQRRSENNGSSGRRLTSRIATSAAITNASISNTL